MGIGKKILPHGKEITIAPMPERLSGYVIMMDGRYIKWHVNADVQHWECVDDPMLASRFSLPMDAMDCRPIVGDYGRGQVVLLRSCIKQNDTLSANTLRRVT